jgi:hypothetical protein
VQLGSANVYTRAFDRLNDGCCGGFGYSSCVNIGNLDGMCGGCKLGSNYEQADNDVIRDELTPKAIAYLARELTDGRNRLKVQGFIDYGGAFAEWWPTGKRDALVGRWLAPAMTKSMYKGIPYGVTVEPGHTPAGKKGALSPELGEVRQLTPREAAKLQDVPSWYVFAGGQAEEYKQIGNGIPVNMGRAVLAHVRDALQRADGQQPGPPPGSMSAGVDQGLFPLGDLSICSNLGSSGMGGSRTDAPKASLWERYSPQTPTKRSRPTGLPSDLPARAEHLVSAAQGWLGQPEASWAWAVLAGETEDETSTEAMETVLMSMGLDPDRMLDRSIAVHAFKLAMETDPGRWDGSPFGDPIYHHTGGKKQSTGRTRGDAGRSDDHTLPTWLAVAAMADMLTYLAVGEGGKKLRLAPVDRETAKAFLAEHHSQLKQLPRRTMYALGAFRGDRLVAIATAGHPSAPWKRLDQRNVLELTRVASDGTVAGASSMLASAILSAAPVSRRGDPDGPWLFVTYSLASEGGHTYKALKSQGLRPVAVIGGKRGKQGARSSASVTAAKGTAAKVRWEAGPAAGAARWDLLEP